VSGGLPERAKISKKSRQHNSLFKSFTNFFRSDSTPHQAQQQQQQPHTSTSSLNTTGKQQLTSLSGRISEPAKQPTAVVDPSYASAKLSAHRYALHSLPARVQALLTGQRRFNQPGDKPVSRLRHVTVYLSSAGTSTYLAALKPSVASDLGNYCEEIGLDLTVVDLGSADSQQGTLQRYLRRALGSCLLTEQLTCRHHSGLFLFVVLLEEEVQPQILCPDRLDVSRMSALREALPEDSDRLMLDAWYSPTTGRFNNERLFSEAETATAQLDRLCALLEDVGVS